ncbi:MULTISPECIES: formate dehydrogenase subunit alpha [unclassified Halorubrum]|uniref:formate dehydrogenase subunit alpha n=1 Tax=unclassified Halorubrum TaxID=2642239 RepID=UPI0010F7437E|nr:MULTISPECIES: formate dehydrogenase subunit alpha [unclassified Halorubrum]TKX45271.1 formate dehydrogenase subunit alpha [Halorubrum sp. ARQ200]TKX51555.1 formate dehydrogenase subunit alpha [Halorubrum sp. ASP121]TKX61263.1 formate dehydrogenase subunit alpha [Halorubrum sp. ASP1]
MSSEPDDAVKTICPYCGVGCGIRVLEGDEPGEMRFMPWGDAPVNEGSVCIKGGAATQVVDHEDRLTEPLIKENGEFREATWEEALGRVVDEMRSIREEHGPDGMGFFGSSKTFNEENYLIQKLARRYGTNQVDNCTRMCHASTVWALRTSLGMGAMTNSMADLEDATDVLWIQGANPGEQHPIANSQYFRQAVLEGATVIQVDPHANKTTRSFEIDETDRHMHLQLKPGTDIPLLNVVLKTILERHEAEPDAGWIDEAFVEERTKGIDHLKETLADFDVEAAAEECGVPLADIELAAEKYAMANDAAIFTGMGMSQHTCGVDNVQNEINLALVTGNLGRPGTGVNPLRGQNNVQGTCDVGAMPNVLPGYQLVDDDEARESVEEVWGFEVPEAPGLTNVEISHAIGDTVHGLYVMGENPIMSEPDGNETERRFREELGFMVVQDIFMTETAELADVVLPATTWAERDGTVTNTDRRVQRMRGVHKVHENTRHDLDILCEVGTRLFDGDEFDFEGPEDVFEELREVCPIMHGMTYDALGETGIHWPCYEEGDEGDSFLYADSFETDDGLGRIEGVVHQEPKETPDEEYPLVLTTARLEEHYNTGTMSRRSPTLSKQHPENFVDVHPNDAERYGIEDGDHVTLKSRRGEITVRADVTEDIKEGVVWTTPHFAAASANRLTNDVLDERAKIPEYKAASAEIEVDIEPAGDGAASADD